MSSKALNRFHQPISVPGPVLKHHIALKFVLKKVSGGGQRSVNMELPLIPFIDFLLCIVLFLLSSFSASGETSPECSGSSGPLSARASLTTASAGASGKVTKKVLPLPSADSTPISPPIASTIRLLTASPIPVPSIAADSTPRRLNG